MAEDKEKQAMAEEPKIKRSTKPKKQESDFITKAELLAFDDAQEEVVEVPEWGGKKILVRGFTGASRDAYEQVMFQLKPTKDGKFSVERKRENLRATLIAATVIDPGTDELMFTQDEVELLGKKSARALDRIFAAAQRVCGIGKEDVEEMVKNSLEGLSDDSTSD